MSPATLNIMDEKLMIKNHHSFLAIMLLYTILYDSIIQIHYDKCNDVWWNACEKLIDSTKGIRSIHLVNQIGIFKFEAWHCSELALYAW